MSISFNSLGGMGRLGNQMFQYASLRGIAANNNLHWMIPPPSTPTIDKYELFDVFEMTHCTPGNIGIQEGAYALNFDFHFDEDIYNDCPDDVDLVGYLQTEKYFLEIVDEIHEDFTFKEKAALPASEYVSIHVRRTDYANFPDYHPMLSVGYYPEAIAMLGLDWTYVVTSDDIRWCKEYFVDSDVNFIFMENTSASADLYIHTQAKHNIIANSSFSWWGAWLNTNPDKRVIAPKRWFGPALDHYYMDDIRPESWEQI